MCEVTTRFIQALAASAALAIGGGTAPANASPAQNVTPSISEPDHGRPVSLDRAIRAYSSGNMSMAIRHAETALGYRLQKPDLRIALHIMCVEQTLLGQAESALVYCERAVDEFGANEPAHLNNRGNANLGAGRVAEAIADYEAALDAANGDELRTIVRGNLDLARSRRGQLDTPRPAASRSSDGATPGSDELDSSHASSPPPAAGAP